MAMALAMVSVFGRRSGRELNYKCKHNATGQRHSAGGTGQSQRTGHDWSADRMERGHCEIIKIIKRCSLSRRQRRDDDDADNSDKDINWRADNGETF